jgi:hypothetical protein
MNQSKNITENFENLFTAVIEAAEAINGPVNKIDQELQRQLDQEAREVCKKLDQELDQNHKPRKAKDGFVSWQMGLLEDLAAEEEAYWASRYDLEQNC